MPIAVNVTEEIHCDELDQAACEDTDHCEWHADEGACEDEGHDHEECDGLDGDVTLDGNILLDVVAAVAVIMK